MITETSIRLNWADALEEWNDGKFSLPSEIKWAFGQQDLYVLCCLHEADKYRNPIEIMLTDCNFHEICELLQNKEYDKCRQLITSDY